MPAMFFDEGKEGGRSRRIISPNLTGHNIAVMLPMISKVLYVLTSGASTPGTAAASHQSACRVITFFL